MKNFHIEEITNDNRRPGMKHQTGCLVRYNPNETHGWLCCRTFATKEEAETFAGTLTEEGQLKETMQKIKIKEITITRAEGISCECGKKHVVSSFEDSERILNYMSRTAPKSGYDVVDFIATFADGETYTGSYNLKYERTETIAEQMKSVLNWYAGLTENPHCGQAQYEVFMARQSPAEIAEAKAFLDTYQIG